MKFKNKQDFKQWNERMFRKYNTERVYLHPNPAIRLVEKRRIQAILKLAKTSFGDKVLEVGCGEGYILNKINKGELYGVDISRTAIARAKQRLAGRPNIKKLIVGDAEKLPFKPRSFDVVICSEVIEHVPDPKKIVKELARVAKPDARIVITFPNEPLINKMKQTVLKAGLFNILLKNIPKKMEEAWHLHSFTLAMFKECVKNDLEIRAIMKIPFRILPLRYAALCRIK